MIHFALSESMMNKNWHAAWLMGLMAVSVAADDAKAKKSVLKDLQGKWVAASATMAGQPFPEEARKSLRLEITDSNYVVHVGPKADKGSLTIDASKSPMTMDIKGKVGPNRGKTFLCIFEIKDGRVRICYGLDGKSRPTEFKSPAGSKFFLVDYEKSP